MSWEPFEQGWRLAPAEGAAHALVVLLHGVGSNARDLMPLADAWRDALPGVGFVSFDGSEPFDGGFGGRQWFSLRDIDEANRAERVMVAAATLEVRLDEELAHWRLGYDALALVGFSQGSMMALYHVATRPEGAAAVVAYSGRLVAPVVARSRTPLTLVHGVDDAVIPVLELERAAGAFSDAGYAVAAYALPGVGHTIDGEGAALGLEALQRVFVQKS
ncbi:alpha/beta hydrolase [Paraburkholderia caballeronis]|uniref:alpha/beta hydrolase n=1 Tax=Paraburkholderia caballeronis TaxID=416943 RepID=UPI0010671914|nr:dienelactone hydrolase family protein [Paraburkholderia caballeronis]TDV13891.1 phospholipase/carboxylesterase [Paraburkholderia caballeronis]TDV15405.1 phospholipase/carboxylesterase [Paraburkholderia caballeronis]TDV24872.1 phospholipase/carboxylesterase [Paraburkholderia caballeronis]TDV38972.1 phospholipase/carboxylesterase [Paraburkholderia caballeronis]